MVKFEGKIGGGFWLPPEERSITCNKKDDTWVCIFDNGNKSRLDDDIFNKCQSKGTGKEGVQCIIDNGQTVYA